MGTEKRDEKSEGPASSSSVNGSAFGSNVVSNGLQQPLGRRSVQQSQHRRISLCRKEEENGQHASSRNVITVQEAQRIGWHPHHQQTDAADSEISHLWDPRDGQWMLVIHHGW